MTTNQRVTDFSIAAILGTEEPRVDIDHQLVDPVYTCMNCNKSFTSTFYLRRHQKYCYKRDGPRVTVGPDRAPTDIANLRQVRDGGKVYQCPYCKYQTKFKGSIKVHLMTHTGERPFTCDVCGKGFIRKVSLNQHIRTHTGEKPYKCYECDYSSSQSTALNRHVATKHTGERIYACNLCSYSTADSSSIKSHGKVHTGEKPYHCQYHEKKKRFMKKHIEQKHAGKNNY